jgi:HK97 family phage portal protein
MSWINKLLGIEKIQKKAMSFPGVYVGAPVTFFKWDKDQNAYSNNDTVYTVVKKVAKKASNVPIYSYLPKSNTTLKRYKHSPVNNVQRYQLDRIKALDEIVSNSALSKLINNPNPSQGSDAFFEGLFSFYVLNGESFIWLNKGGIENGEVLEMYLIPPNKVEIVPDPQDLYGVLGYVLDIGGKMVPVDKTDIIHWKTFNPNFDPVDRTHLRGFNPLQPLKRRLQQDNDAMEAAVAMFQNGGAKGVMFNETLDNLTPEQSSQLKSVIDNKINNTAMKAAVATLQGKWGYLDIGKDSVDMQLLDSQDKTMERIATAMGVDPDILVPGQSFSNKEWAQKKFVTDLIMPLCNSLRDELNRVLVPSFGSREYLDFDFSALPELQDDYSKMSTVYNSMFDRGAITGNEYRQLLGFEVTTEQMHNKYLITGNYGLIEDIDIPNEDVSNDSSEEYNDYMA